MKRTVLIKTISTAAGQADIVWVFVRQGGNHEVWQCGSVRIIIPRHREINELTAEGILKRLASELGEDWWR